MKSERRFWEAFALLRIHTFTYDLKWKSSAKNARLNGLVFLQIRFQVCLRRFGLVVSPSARLNGGALPAREGALEDLTLREKEKLHREE